MNKPFEVVDATRVIDKLHRYNKALALHTWSLVQKCREDCLAWREYLKKVKDFPGTNYVTKRSHVSMTKGRVAGLTDGLVIAGVLTPGEAEILCDYAYALK